MMAMVQPKPSSYALASLFRTLKDQLAVNLLDAFDRTLPGIIARLFALNRLLAHVDPQISRQVDLLDRDRLASFTHNALSDIDHRADQWFRSVKITADSQKRRGDSSARRITACY